MFTFSLLTLAVYRIAHFFVEEDGPFAVNAWLLKITQGTTVGDALECFYCMSLWAAVLVNAIALYLGIVPSEFAIFWVLGTSAAASIVYDFAKREGDNTTDA